jgi:16S rRNA (adenine1518-N6/adenine1519-N6)-dimethyltransferase
MQHRPRKRFSQNFLVDRHYIERIVDAIGPKRDDRMIEIGPGRGALTRPLLERVDRLTVIEIDRDLAEALRAEHPPSRLTVITADALATDLAALDQELVGLRVVGNLPYHISSPLLFHCAEYVPHIADLHFMLQAEVVDRMAAAPGTPEYGRLSVSLQSVFAVEKLFRVPAGAFQPMPAVESAVVRLTPLGAVRPLIRDQGVFETIVAAGFGQRRKTLRNALQKHIGEQALLQLGVDPGARAETLPVAVFAAIANAVALAQEAS